MPLTYTQWLKEINKNRGKNCPEKPELRRFSKLRLYHCPYCSMVLIAGVEHLEPDFLLLDMYLLDLIDKPEKDLTPFEKYYLEDLAKQAEFLIKHADLENLPQKSAPKKLLILHHAILENYDVTRLLR